MRGSFSSLLLAATLVALSASVAAGVADGGRQQSAPEVASSETVAPKAPKKAASVKAGKPASTSPTAKSATSAKQAKPASAKGAGKADCDEPAPKVTAAKPPAVPVDPFAPVVAPCAESKP